MFQLNNLKPAPGATKKKRRVGRGQGSGRGGTSTRGENGQGSRSGGPQGPWFEGGQMPLYRRLPKKGFAPRNRVPYQVINLADFERFEGVGEITPEYLASVGAISGRNPRVKILADGELKGSFKVSVHAVSANARQKIEGSGGSVEILPWTRTGRGDGSAEKAGK